MGNVGNRVRLSFERPPAELVARFADQEATRLADAMHRTGAMYGLDPMYLPIKRVVGVAVTVKVPSGDSLMVRKAMELAQPGDVIVVDGRGCTTRSLWGGNRSLAMARQGVHGAIIDGAVRDVEESRELDFPLFARGICPMASSSTGPGEVNFPIACGGVVVCPGDIIVAEREGIVVIPRADAEDVLARLTEVEAREAAMVADAEAGLPRQRAEVDAALTRSGCQVLER